MSPRVLPFYLLCDESGSMAGAPLDEVNDCLPKLHSVIAGDPFVAARSRFCLIGFADEARVLLPLTDLAAVNAIPVLDASGQTSYGRAFGLLRRTIDRDARRLTADGYQVLRPAVFFLSDGLPTDDDWPRGYAELTDASWPWRPEILAFGFGDADMHTIGEIATARAFIADGSRGVGDALREFAESLIRSIVDSASSGEPSLPYEVPGFAAILSEQC